MFIKEIKLIIPNSQRINRGASKLDEVGVRVDNDG